MIDNNFFKTVISFPVVFSNYKLIFLIWNAAFASVVFYATWYPFVMISTFGEWKIFDTRYPEKLSSTRISSAWTNGEGRTERKRWAKNVELQRRQIPRAQQNGQTYRYSFVTISNFRSTNTFDDDRRLSSFKLTRSCFAEILPVCVNNFCLNCGQIFKYP